MIPAEPVDVAQRKIRRSMDMNAPQLSPPTPTLWDVTGTLARLGGDPSLLYEVVKIFVDQAPHHLQVLRLALAQGDAEAVERTAHSLKGELGYLGVSRASQRARELEELGGKHELEKAAEIFMAFDREISALLESMRDSRDELSRAASSGKKPGRKQ